MATDTDTTIDHDGIRRWVEPLGGELEGSDLALVDPVRKADGSPSTFDELVLR